MGRGIKIRQFLVREKGVGLCIVNEDNNTITYPNGYCKRLEQHQISHLKGRHKLQDMRGSLL